MLDTPILFVVFNRPNTTARVFEEIRKAKPKQLYVAADGPRNDREGESVLVGQVREIATNIDWSCEVKTLFRDENLGCKKAVSSAITWFFDHEEEGIILEDDCLPNQSFFNFCEENLDEYRDNLSIWHISGSSPLNVCNFSESYYYSRYPWIWGWATWRSRWERYRIEYNNISINDIIPTKSSLTISKRFWASVHRDLIEKDLDTWDYQWVFSIWYNDGYSVNPFKNMISNIGFNESATHTKNDIYGISNKQRKDINKLVHPSINKYNFIIDILIRIKLFDNKLIFRIFRLNIWKICYLITI